jgi:hypothetical protein
MDSFLPPEVICNIDKYTKRLFIFNQIPISPIQANQKEFSIKLEPVSCYVAAINEIILECGTNFNFHADDDNIITKFDVKFSKIFKKTRNIAQSIGYTTMIAPSNALTFVLTNYYKMVGWKIKIKKINNTKKNVLWCFSA